MFIIHNFIEKLPQPKTKSNQSDSNLESNYQNPTIHQNSSQNYSDNMVLTRNNVVLPTPPDLISTPDDISYQPMWMQIPINVALCDYLILGNWLNMLKLSKVNNMV